MPSFPDLPRTMRGAIVLLDPDNGKIGRLITLQFNPETLTRTLQVQNLAAESGDRAEALRLTGPPVETIKLDAEIDATDQKFELPLPNRLLARFGIQPQLAALEMLIYPKSSRIEANRKLAEAGTLEIIPAQSELTLFVWSVSRILPVRITDFSISEEFFDSALNPIRAKVSLGMRVLNHNDLGFGHRGSGMFMRHHKLKEQLVNLNLFNSAGVAVLGAIR